MKLLLRRELDVAAEEEGTGTAIVASMYRRNVDGGYKQLILEGASAGVFDCFILDCIKVILEHGKGVWQ